MALDEKVKRILRAKYQLGLTDFEAIENRRVRAELNAAKVQALKRKLIENALTLVRNEGQQIPLTGLNVLVNRMGPWGV